MRRSSKAGCVLVDENETNKVTQKPPNSKNSRRRTDNQSGARARVAFNKGSEFWRAVLRAPERVRSLVLGLSKSSIP